VEKSGKIAQAAKSDVYYGINGADTSFYPNSKWWKQHRQKGEKEIR